MINHIELPRVKIAFTALALVAISLSTVGGTVSAASTSQTEQTNKSVTAPGQLKQESQLATDLRAGLKTLLQEHVTTNLTVNRLIAEGASQQDLAAALSAQEANSTALANAIGSIYGDEAGAGFFELFQEHIDASNEFAVAVAAGDEAAKVAANEELEEYLIEITDFLVGAINVLPRDAVLGLLEQHESLINQSTESFANDNFGQSKKVEIQAIKQIAVIADALASGIITTQKL